MERPTYNPHDELDIELRIDLQADAMLKAGDTRPATEVHDAAAELIRWHVRRELERRGELMAARIEAGIWR